MYVMKMNTNNRNTHSFNTTFSQCLKCILWLFATANSHQLVSLFDPVLTAMAISSLQSNMCCIHQIIKKERQKNKQSIPTHFLSTYFDPLRRHLQEKEPKAFLHFASAGHAFSLHSSTSRRKTYAMGGPIYLAKPTNVGDQMWPQSPSG